MLGIFVYMFICEVTTTKVNFVFTNNGLKRQRLICERAIFAQNASTDF